MPINNFEAGYLVAYLMDPDDSIALSSAARTISWVLGGGITAKKATNYARYWATSVFTAKSYTATTFNLYTYIFILPCDLITYQSIVHVV